MAWFEARGAPDERVPPVRRARQDHHQVLAAVAAGDDGPVPVREEIQASWRRALTAGLDPESFAVPSEEVDAEGRVSGLAQPVLEQLSADLGEAPFAVVLTDAKARVLQRKAVSKPLLRRLDAIWLAPGFVYAEPVAGTNAIGTALAQRAPSIVEGAEHFADALTGMACAATPIRDPSTGRTVAALDLTCVDDDANPLMLALVRRAARDIEARVLDDSGVARRAMLARFLRERGRAKHPFLLIDGDVVMMNAAADRLVTPGDEQMLRAWADAPAAPSVVTLASGQSAIVSAERRTEPDFASAVMLHLRLADPPEPAAATRDRASLGCGALTPAEQSVAVLVAEGLTNRQVAERLLMSRFTVDSYLRAIFQKLGVNSRVALARTAINHAAIGDDLDPG